ncbi:Fe-S cluster assembly protein SufD [Capnocytophaga sp. G2]|uniref:Fe-S cluster assembly protein SufD n=1 Tax=Capnocytophaga sp. G2 TaxID=3110695 RepID=UPI002B48DBA2|nr:Fe-S cluster assembly protein SufD [Capnocytophaga sp. G2]MEB3003958.1 Fe-S cluster assembly protein SufD [Capnocytophaga sp. G2]
MNLKEKWVAAFEAFPHKDDILKDIRKEALSFFAEKGFPNKKVEAWKYTSLTELQATDYHLWQPVNKKTTLLPEVLYKYAIADCYQLVFVNGYYSPEMSSKELTGVTVTSLLEALHKGGEAFIQKYFNANTEKGDIFTAINTAFASEGVYIEVPKGKVVEKPIQLLYFNDRKETTCYQPRNIIVVGENAQLKVIEMHQNLSDAATAILTNAVTEVFVAKSAFLDYYKLQNDSLTASLIDNTYISQEANSHASVHTFSFGGTLTRNNLNFYHQGEYLESTLKGLSILKGTQHTDHYTLVNHAHPNCESHQDYKSIVNEEATNVFNGKIMVEQIAQKTNAYQQNDNILLSDKATVYTKPQLEIFADDVKCSHGCTVGSLSADSLFYLQTRGIGKKEAAALLTYAFANTVLESVKIPALSEYINAIIAEKLGVTVDF